MIRRISSIVAAEQNHTFELVNRNARDEQSLAAFLLVGIEWYLSTHEHPKRHAVTDQMRPYWEAVRSYRLAHAPEEAKGVLRRRCGWHDGRPWPRTAAANIDDADGTPFASLRSEILGIYTRSAEVNTILIAYSLDQGFAELIDAFRLGTAGVTASEIVHRARRIRGGSESARLSTRASKNGPIEKGRALRKAVLDVATVANALRDGGFIGEIQRNQAVQAFSEAIRAPAGK